LIFEKTPEREIRGNQLYDLKNCRSESRQWDGETSHGCKKIWFWNKYSFYNPENKGLKTDQDSSWEITKQYPDERSITNCTRKEHDYQDEYKGWSIVRTL